MDRKKIVRLIRIIISSVLLAAAYIYGTGGLLSGYLCIISYLISGYDVLWKAVRNIFRGQIFDENFLMSAASVGAIITGEHPEAAAVMIFYSIGQLFESIAAGKSRKSIAALLKIRPDSASVIRGEEIITVSPDSVEIGETIIVRPGEKIPIDGTVSDGNASIDTSPISGESIPRDVTVGDKVFSGSVNLSGVIRICTDSLYENSTASKIIELVQTAAEKKAPTERFITRFAKWYTPAVCAFALLTAVIPPLFGGKWMEWIHRALLCLVVSCPCALVISVPLAFFGAIGGASRRGILIKGAEVIENLANTDTAVFDKTGTLTNGCFKVTSVCPVSGTEADTLLEYAAAAESMSLHPIAKSISGAYGKSVTADSIREIAGMGICAEYKGNTVLAGNFRLMEKYGVDVSENHCAGTTVYIASNGDYLGNIIISDILKDEVPGLISSLDRLGITRRIMLTGDNEITAKSVAASAGINDVRHSLLPEGKSDAMDEIIKEGKKKVLYIGDGINDAPVLARADTGIAMGALGCDAAIEAADMVIMDDDINKLADAVRLSRSTMRIAVSNIVIALAVKFTVIILAAAGIANMWLAVFADVGVLIIAILNSMRTLVK